MYVHENIKDCVVHYEVDIIDQSISDTFHKLLFVVFQFDYTSEKF